MSNISLFQNEKWSVRGGVDDAGEPWFVAKDVAVALGYERPENAIERHCKGSLKRGPLQTAGGTQQVRIIGEPDVYRLIFGSKLETAQEFENWVVSDVLPSIRKTGSYGASQDGVIAALNDPAAMRNILLSYTEKVLTLEGRVEEMRPQVEALERISVADGSLCVTDAAKTLQVRPKWLFSFLRSHGWIYRRPNSGYDIAYQSKLAMGLLEHKTTTIYRSDGTEQISTQVRVTPKGLARLAQEFPPAAEVA